MSYIMDNKKEPYTFRIEPSVLEKLKKKAGTIPISVVIRRLIERYINDKVGLDD